MHAYTQQFVDRTSASVRLSDSFVNFDSCVADGFFFFFGVWIRHIRPIFSLPQLAFYLTSTPTVLDSYRHRSSISLTTAPRQSSILFAKHVSFEHSVSSPVITSRREKNNKAKVFQHPIDSHSQSASCSLISPHFAAGAVGVGRSAASFLATEGTGTVPIPTDDTRCWPLIPHLVPPTDSDESLRDAYAVITLGKLDGTPHIDCWDKQECASKMNLLVHQFSIFDFTFWTCSVVLLFLFFFSFFSKLHFWWQLSCLQWQN